MFVVFCYHGLIELDFKSQGATADANAQLKSQIVKLSLGFDFESQGANCLYFPTIAYVVCCLYQEMQVHLTLKVNVSYLLNL